jgi:hypothetical protein
MPAQETNAAIRLFFRRATDRWSETMSDHKKKGDFDQWQKESVGGDKKQRENRNEDSRTGGQNSGHGGHR